MWDPCVGFGQTALSDPVRHILHPVFALLRFVPSDVVGFNLAVALPVPIAAVGMYLFLNRRVGASAAALGSIAFAASGPMLSTANMLNFSWAAAALPWVLLAVDSLIDQHSPRGFALASIAYAMLLLAGEGPTVVGGGILTAVYALASAPRGERLRAAIRVTAAGISGVALAGVLSIPFIYATLGSLICRLAAGIAGAFVLVEHSGKLRRYGLAIVFVTSTLDPVLAGINLFPMADVKSVAEP